MKCFCGKSRRSEGPLTISLASLLYTVHISASDRENGTGSFGGDSWQSFQGFDLKGIISELYSITPIRIELPASLEDGRRYDFSLVLPQAESRRRMNERFRQAVEDYFHITAARRSHMMDVYVVAALGDRKPPAVSQQSEGGGIQNFSIEFSLPERTGTPDFEGMPKKISLNAVTSISEEGTVQAFCNMLESSLDRPALNETNLQGQFEFRIATSPTANGDFLVRLRNELGLAIERAKRNVQLLVFSPR